jgi:predicted nucleotidyltransferase
MSNESLNNILNSAYEKTVNLFGSSLSSAILYGSYARGDYDIESDLDIAVLVNLIKSIQTFLCHKVGLGQTAITMTSLSLQRMKH